MRTPRDSIYAGHRYPAEIISYAVWLYFRFPLSLRMVGEMLAARGISVTHETIRQWGLKFGPEFANRIRRRAPRRGDKWHLDEVVVSFAWKKHWLWRAVDQDGFVLDVLVQSRRDKEAAKRLFRKLLKKQGRAPRVLVTVARITPDQVVEQTVLSANRLAQRLPLDRRPSRPDPSRGPPCCPWFTNALISHDYCRRRQTSAHDQPVTPTALTARSAPRAAGTSADRGFRAGRHGGGVVTQCRDGSA
jgi:hypothetical protein